MKTQWWLAGALVLVPGAWAARTALPGTVNYIEGQVTINGQTMAPQQDGSVSLTAGQTLSVANGKAEILLSPGTFLRVGNGSQVQMVSTELIDPRIEVLHGEAMVEVDYKPKMARLDVMERGADTQLLKEGLYRFDADQGMVQVVDGKASVAQNGQNKDIGRGKELVLSNAKLKPVSFNWKSEDNLYRWSSVRSGYLAQANQASAQTIYVDGGWGPGWGMGWGSGWYWNPYYATYSWLPGDGFFWSPFGYPFFSPGYVVYAPVIRLHNDGGFGHTAGRGFVGAGRVGSIAAAPRFSGGGFSGARAGGGFSGGGMGGARMGGGHMGGGGRR